MNHLPLNTSQQIIGLIYWVDGAWFWRDEDCEEPMGPFETRDEASADYRELRHGVTQ